MQTAESTPSDFDLLTALVCRLQKFSYVQLQDTVRRIQSTRRVFQNYFQNSGDVEGVDPPESIQLGFHLKVLYQLGYIQHKGAEYIISEKCKQNEVNLDGGASSLIEEILPVSSR
jgi:hypothetical protein